MSVAQSQDISDIHPATVVTVPETLSVSPTGSTVVTVSQPQTLVTVPAADTQTVVPSVGASISVPDSSPVGSISERSSSALLNLASNSLSLTEILSAQQQALEQFQVQLQLAQQTETINQRLDAIERTLNSLIQQKVQEDAAKNQESTPVRPSQQVHLQSTPELGGEGLGIDILKRKKLPRELCSKVRSTYHTMNLEFKIDERFLSPANQRVTDALIDTVYNDTSAAYSVKDIKRAAHRYYESRRRVGIEDLPDRQEKAAENRKKRKYRARQQRAFDRRSRYVRDTESRYWEHITAGCMTEESDDENGEKIVTHQLLWRSDFLNQFIFKLDNRYDKNKKPGTGSTVKRERVTGLPSTSQPPPSLPAWMIDPNYKLPATVMMAGPSEVPEGTATVGGDVTAYSSLIGEVHEVHDDSSDFELPDTVVA